jgi:gamma-glutamyltranspeptidase/glutathione hydrolase
MSFINPSRVEWSRHGLPGLQARPGVVVVEDRVPMETVTSLRDRGHQVEVGPAWSEGRLVVASRDKDRMKAAANPRGMQGYAVGR